MSLFRSLAARRLIYVLFLGLCFAAQSAQAYFQVVYTSQHMPMTSGIGIGEIDPTSRPALRISFTIDENDWLANSRFQVDPSNFFIELASPDNGFSPMGFSVLPPSSLDISLNANRQVSAWRFDLFLEDEIPKDLSPLDQHLRELTDARA